MGAIEIRGSTGDSSGAGVAAPSGSSGADVGDEGPPDWLGAGVEAPFDAHGAADAVPVAAAAVVVDTPTSHCPTQHLEIPHFISEGLSQTSEQSKKKNRKD